MPKSAIDATRFTPTTPHASAKHPPSPPSSNVASSSTASPLPNRTMPGPPGETPQQKVRRLREAAARARDAKVSGFDRVLVRGRVWADRAHRFTALSLIGITGLSFHSHFVPIFSLHAPLPFPDSHSHRCYGKRFFCFALIDGM